MAPTLTHMGIHAPDPLFGTVSDMQQDTHSPYSFMTSRRSHGFTLIELAVAVATIAVLIAITIVTLTKVRVHAQDRAAQTTLDVGIKTVVAMQQDTGGILPELGDTISVMSAREPSISVTSGESTGWHVISVARPDASTAILATLSDSGTCWYTKVSGLQANFYGSDEDATTCNAGASGVDPSDVTGDSWVNASTVTSGPCTDYSTVVLADSPLLYWRLNELSGSTAADASPNGNDGTFTGGVTFAASGIPNCAGDLAVTLDGSSGYISKTFAAALNPAQFSIEAWVKPSDLTHIQGIAGMWDNTDPRVFGGAATAIAPHETEGQWLMNSPMVVSNASNPVYAAYGIPNPPTGGVFRIYDPQTDTMGNAVYADDTAEALRSAITLYEATSNAQYLTLATQMGTFLSSSIVSGTAWGYPVYFVSERWEYNAGSWSLQGQSETHTRTSLNSAYALLRLYQYDNTTTIGGKTFGQWAALLLDTVHKGQDVIATSPSYPAWMSGALPQFWTDTGAAAYVPSWRRFPLFNADVAYMAFTEGISQLGDSQLDQSSNPFTYSATRDAYGSWLTEALTNQGAYMSDTNGSYVTLPYQFMSVDDADWAGGAPFTPVPQNNYGASWGDVAWTSDAQFWTVDGLVRYDPVSYSGLWDTLTSYKIGDSYLFYDSYNPDGTANSSPTKDTATQAAALAVRSGNVIGRDVAGFTQALVQTRWVTPSTAMTNGGWTWSGTWNETMEGIASAVASGQLTGQTTSAYWRRQAGIGDAFSGADGNVLVPDTWAHVVLTYNGSTLSLYVNGVLRDSEAVSGFAPNDSESFFAGARLATDTLSDFLSGSIDEVAVYDYALSPATVSSHYVAGTS